MVLQLNKKISILVIAIILILISISGFIIGNSSETNSTVEINGLKFILSSEYANNDLNEYSGHTAYSFGDGGSNIDVFTDKSQYEDRLSAYQTHISGGFMENFTNASTKTIEGNEIQIFSDNNGRITYFFTVNDLGVVFEYYTTLNLNPESIIASFYKK